MHQADGHYALKSIKSVVVISPKNLEIVRSQQNLYVDVDGLRRDVHEITFRKSDASDFEYIDIAHATKVDADAIKVRKPGKAKLPSQCVPTNFEDARSFLNPWGAAFAFDTNYFFECRVYNTESPKQGKDNELRLL